MSAESCENTLKGPSEDDFVYDSLDHSVDSIRLIEVLPASPDGQIRVRMIHAQTSTEYWCLSYMWGPPSEFEILVNDSLIHVRENLYHFLQTAQKRYHGQLLWIDALCIDQNNHMEKNHQVQQMGQIYRGAEEVLIWLGDIHLDCILGFLAEAKLFFDGDSETINREKLEKDLANLITQRHRGVEDEISQMRTNPYWNRTWIAQEVILGRRLHVTCETGELHHYHLDFLFEQVMRRLPSRMFPMLYESAPRWYWEKNKDFTLANSDFWAILKQLRNSHCVDPRDRIYGQLSLVEEGADFDVNYDENISSLFWRAGTNFNAWLRLENMQMLSTALGMTSQSLQGGLTITGPPEVFIDYMRILRDTGKKTHCDECKHVNEALKTSSNVRTLMFRGTHRGHYSFNSHVLLRQERNGGQSIVLHPLHNSRKISSYTLPSDALQRLEEGSWRETDAIELLDTSAASNQRYRVRIPPQYILDCLKYSEVEFSRNYWSNH